MFHYCNCSKAFSSFLTPPWCSYNFILHCIFTFSRFLQSLWTFCHCFLLTVMTHQRTSWNVFAFFLCSHVHLCGDCIYQIDFRNASLGHKLKVIRWFRALRNWESLLEIMSRSNVPLTAILRIQESSIRRETLWFWYLCTAWASRRVDYSFRKPGRSDEQNGGDWTFFESLSLWLSVYVCMCVVRVFFFSKNFLTFSWFLPFKIFHLFLKCW